MRYVVILTTFAVCSRRPAAATADLNGAAGVATRPPPAPFACDTFVHMEDHEVHCFGRFPNDELPNGLNRSLNKIIITDSDVKYIRRNSFQEYGKKLQDITLSNLPYLRVIEEGTFANIPNLRTIYISHAPQLKFLHGLLRNVISTSFKTLRIVNTGLQEVPDLFHLPPGNTMFLLELDHNKIEVLARNSIKITAEQVTINFNNIHSVEDFAFNGSQIAKLDLRGNRRFTSLGENAFKGLRNLRILDLSETAIESIPVEGLKELEILKIENTPTMQTIPSIYDLSNLKVAKLTHHFHCCAFKYPEQHNPTKHAEYEKTMKEYCKESGKSLIGTGRKRKRRALEYSRYVPAGETTDKAGGNATLVHPLLYREMAKAAAAGETLVVDGAAPLRPLRGQTIGFEEAKMAESAEGGDDDDGFFHSSPTNINETAVDVYCGKITFRRPEVDCSPEPNALNPCEDIMGFVWLRASVWFVVVAALVGNLCVIVAIVFSRSPVNVSRFLICNLAFADLCMGLYLLLIASMDCHSVGTYFNFAFNWQYGLGCQIAGFLTVFACHLSIFTLSVITLERWFAITYAIHLTRRIRLGAAIKVMVAGWVYSVFISSLPLFGVSNYSSTSICLPMEVDSIIDKVYLYGVIIGNGLAFIGIAVCYAQIYFSLAYETRRSNTSGELSIAKKMALLIVTDFATWAPIAFFALSALAGYPLIGVTKSKILLVFFYPLNACANPYLYALMTAQFRRDLYMIVSRCGLCRKKAEQYKLSETIPTSKPVPLLHSTNSNGPRSDKLEVAFL